MTKPADLILRESDFKEFNLNRTINEYLCLAYLVAWRHKSLASTGLLYPCHTGVHGLGLSGFGT